MLSNSSTGIIDTYWERVKNNGVVLSIEDLLLMRVSAFKFITSDDEIKRNTARKFLLASMTQSEKEYDFSTKEAFVKNVDSWEQPEILAQRNDDINAIVYKIPYHVKGIRLTLHEIAFFIKDRDQHLKYTHKYNLSELSEKYCAAKTNGTHIRQIGDPVLHQEALQVVDFSESGQSQINSQVELLKEVLFKTGGVGIAANQCLQLERPLKIILSGVDYQNPEHVVKAVSRYPSALFPQMRICINPTITSVSKETEDFAEGCLSVQGTLRALVVRPVSLTVGYQDIVGNKHSIHLTGSDARVMLHEIDHILNGKVYIQRIIEELTIYQLNRLINIFGQILPQADSHAIGSTFTSPVVIFKRNSDGTLMFDDNEIQHVFSSMSVNVLNGIHQDIVNELQKRTNPNIKLFDKDAGCCENKNDHVTSDNSIRCQR